MDTNLKTNNLKKQIILFFLVWLFISFAIVGFTFFLKLEKYFEPTDLVNKNFIGSKHFYLKELSNKITTAYSFIENPNEKKSSDYLTNDYGITYVDKNGKAGWINSSDSNVKNKYLYFIKKGPNIETNIKSPWLKQLYIKPKTEFKFFFSKDYILKEEKIWLNNLDFVIIILIAIGLSLILALVFFIMYTANLLVNFKKSILTDIATEFIFIAFAFMFLVATNIYNEAPFIVFFILSIALLGLMYSSIVLKFKTKTFIKKSITYSLFNILQKVIRGLVKRDNKKTETILVNSIIFITISSIIAIFLKLSHNNFVLLIIIELAIIYFYVKDLIRNLKDIDTKIDYTTSEKNKSDLMKIELITNVSHDLKTPLTAIISYSDLLKKEDLNEKSKEYVNIIHLKSKQLSNILSDIIELSKTTTGNAEVELEELNITTLVKQVISDNEDIIEKSNKNFKIKIDEVDKLVRTDGNRIYRAITNLIDNSIKYSLDETRIFINLHELNNLVIFEIINTSNYNLDVSEEEILQRFFRANKARDDQGSGLGLSIAQSFSHIANAKLEVKITGDQFKALIIFKK